MPISPFNLCGETSATRDSLWNSARAINWFPITDTSGSAQSKVELAPIPGLTTFTTLTNPPIRGLWAGDNRLFAVAAGELYEIFSNGAATAITGGVLSAATPVQFAANGTSLLVASGDQIWYATGGVSHKTYDGAISVVYLDGYYIILLADGQTIQISGGSTPGLTWDPLDTAQSQGPVDRKVRLEAHEGHLWLFGQRSISVWYDSGNADFPFAPIDGATIDQGTMAPWSVTRIDRKLYWLGMNEHGYGRVFRTEGYTPVPISNQAIEHLIKTYLDLGTDQCITGSGYTENGHTFYVLSFPKAKACLVYNLSTNMWHERARWNADQWQHWRGASFHAFCFGKHIVARTSEAPFPDGDHTKIYEQGLHIYGDDGNRIRRYRAAPYTQADQQWLFHHYLRLLTSGSSAVTMRYLYDDNTTWSNERTVAPFKHEIKYRRLGRARDRMYELYLLDSLTEAQGIIEGYLHLADPPQNPATIAR
jgi:hypothetical protein